MPKCLVSDTMRTHVVKLMDYIEDKTTDPQIKAEANTIRENINALNFCNPAKKGEGKRRKRAPSANRMFLSQCMKSEQKGGLGLNMGDCQARWKTMSDDDKQEYVKAADVSEES